MPTIRGENFTHFIRNMQIYFLKIMHRKRLNFASEKSKPPECGQSKLKIEN